VFNHVIEILHIIYTYVIYDNLAQNANIFPTNKSVILIWKNIKSFYHKIKKNNKFKQNKWVDVYYLFVYWTCHSME